MDLYQPPQPEVERLKPTERKKPVEPKPVEPKPAETEPAGDPAQTPDKKPPVVKPKDPDKKNTTLNQLTLVLVMIIKRGLNKV